MASKKIEKGSEEWQFFNDYYKFREQFYEADNAEEWFEEMAKIGTKLCQKYKNTNIAKYARKLVLAHMDDVEERYRKD